MLPLGRLRLKVACQNVPRAQTHRHRFHSSAYGRQERETSALWRKHSQSRSRQFIQTLQLKSVGIKPLNVAWLKANRNLWFCFGSDPSGPFPGLYRLVHRAQCREVNIVHIEQKCTKYTVPRGVVQLSFYSMVPCTTQYCILFSVHSTPCTGNHKVYRQCSTALLYNTMAGTDFS